jgi:hypothetical protein
MVLMGCLLSKKTIYKFIEHSIKMNPWKGNTEYQYNTPNSSWFKGSLDKVLFIILNSSHACPGSFISAYRTSFPSSLLAYKHAKV